MKTLKWIVTNLILVIMLVILTGNNIVFAAERLNITVDIHREGEGSQNIIVEFKSDGEAISLDEIKNNVDEDGKCYYKTLDVKLGDYTVVIHLANEDGTPVDEPWISEEDQFFLELPNDRKNEWNQGSYLTFKAPLITNFSATLNGADGDEVKDEVTTFDDLRTIEDFFKALEEFLAWLTRSLANGLNYLVQMSLKAMGGTDEAVDIEDVIFNHYPDTYASFFTKTENEGPSSRLVELFRESVSKWYNVFNAIAAAGYLAIFLYIGVKILLRVGGKNQGKYKEALMSWCAGILILIFFPNAIKFAIEINNSLVQLIEESKTSILGIDTIKSSVSSLDMTIPAVGTEEMYNELAAQIDENPYTGGDSYMAIMAQDAHDDPTSLVKAIIYLVMVWQFIMIIIIYYKRIFTITFLIAIFPFVALSYAFDKIGDGKAQAFETWTKEIMTNIFIQSIHAFVYVFAVGAAYEGGKYSGDWIMMIMGISFMFQGEQILKKIIGQEAETLKSLTETATKAVATIAVGRKVASSVADNVVGAHSHLGKTIKNYREWRREVNTVRNFDNLTFKPEIPPASSTTGFKPELANNPEYMEVANAIQVVNNLANASPEELSRAIDTLMKHRNSSNADIQDLMKTLNISEEQLDALANAQQNIVDALIDGDKSTPEKYSELKEKIDHDLDIHLEAIVPGDRVRRHLLKRALYYRLRDGDEDSGKHKIRSTEFIEVKEEIKKAKKRKKSFWGVDIEELKEKNRMFRNASREKFEQSTRGVSNRILSTHYMAPNNSYTASQKRMAENLAIVKDISDYGRTNRRDVPKYTPMQAWKAVSYVAEHENDSRENKNAVKSLFGMKGEEIKAIVAEEIGKQYTDMEGDPRNFREAFAKKIGPRKYEIEDATTDMERKMATAKNDAAWRLSMEYIMEQEENAGDRLCYDESLDEISVKDILRKERITDIDDDDFDEAYAGYIIKERKQKNHEEMLTVEDFAREQLDDLPEENVVKYKGQTKEEHEEYSKELRSKFVQELTRTGATTTGVILGAPMGAGLGMGLSPDAPIAQEALAGAAAGVYIGDTIAEIGMGKGEKAKIVKIFNPYTGETEDVKLEETASLGGIFRLDDIKDNEVLKMDDNRLIGFQYDIRKQFIKSNERKNEEERKKKKQALFSDALGKTKK